MTNQQTNKPSGYVGWAIPENERDNLLAIYRPIYDRVIARHCTLSFGVPADFPLPVETHGLIIGISDDGRGVQALVLNIGGRGFRPGGGAFHITWSLAPGRQPVESNKVISDYGFDVLTPRRITLIPTFFPLGV